MAGHRAWRVRIDSVENHGRHCSGATSIEFYATRTGPDLTISAPGNAIANDATYGSAANAFDHNGGSVWADGCSAGAGYIGWDFGSDPDDWPDVVGFLFQARNDGYANQDSIEDGGLEYSDDVSAWTRRFDVETQSGWGQSEIRYFFDPAVAVVESGGYRYWKFIQTALLPGDYSGFSGCDLRNLAGASLPHRSQTLDSGLQAGSVASLFAVSDGTALAQWYDGTGNYFIVDFLPGNERAVRKVWLYPNKDDVNRSWTEIDVYASEDGSSYTLIDHISTTWVAHTAQEFTIAGGGSATIRRRSIVVC